MNKAEQTAKIFGCTKEQAVAQAVKGVNTLEQMHKKALGTGRKINGYTAVRLEQLISNMRSEWGLDIIK